MSREIQRQLKRDGWELASHVDALHDISMDGDRVVRLPRAEPKAAAEIMEDYLSENPDLGPSSGRKGSSREGMMAVYVRKLKEGEI
jgi:hypothetical protein